MVCSETVSKYHPHRSITTTITTLSTTTQTHRQSKAPAMVRRWNVLRISILVLHTSCCYASPSFSNNHHYHTPNDHPTTSPLYGRVSEENYVLTPQQISQFHQEGCCTLPNVLTETEVSIIEQTFDQFLNREIHVPGKDFCDMSKPFDTPFDEWSIVNCMLPTRYHPPFSNNLYERITKSIARQLYPNLDMTKDYDQLLNKRPGRHDAIFSWHQDMGYWPSSVALGLSADAPTETCTFSLAIDDSDEHNGCLRYLPGSHTTKTLRSHVPLHGSDREDGHALALQIDESKDVVKLAPASRGSVTIHNEYVVHGSGGNRCGDRQRRTYVIAYRPRMVVEAERRIGFSHSHNDVVNWDSFG